MDSKQEPDILQDRDVQEEATQAVPQAAPAGRKRAWWLLGATAMAGALAINAPRWRKLFTVHDVATGRTPEYPDIQPVTLAASMGVVFDAAVSVCDDLNWRVVQEDRLENFVLAEINAGPAFTSDVLIEFLDTGNGVRVEVVSRSRSRWSGLGENVRQIRAFLREMNQLPSVPKG